jgi:hypothetical protein
MNDVLQVLLDMRNGAVAADVNSKFDALVEAVLDTGGKGKLTVELIIEPSKKGMGGVVLEVSASHTCKLSKPELAIGSSVFFVSEQGKLTRDDPAQERMFQQEVKK